MSLFIHFTGNVYNSENNLLTSYRYRGFHLETRKWSEWYSSKNETQYNFNLGDAAWLTQDGVSNVNDTIIIMVETLEAKPIDRSFAMISFNLTSSPSYVNDIQLLPCSKPNVIGLWGLNSPTDGLILIKDDSRPGYTIYSGRVGERISVEQTFNDEHSWVFKDVKHYHASTYLDLNIFQDRIGIDTILYDWSSGTYISDDYHVYDYVSAKQNNGYYVVKAKVRNLAGLIVIDTIYIKVKNSRPILTYSWDPINPTIKTPFKITGNIEDNSTALIKVTHYFDGIMIASNVKKVYEWEQSLGLRYRKTHKVKGLVVWSDGFGSQSYETIVDITMLNIPPSFSVSESESLIEDNILLTCNELEDADGETANVRLRWELYFKTPLDNEYKKIFNTIYPESPNDRFINIPLTVVGQYKAICYAIDEADGENYEEVEFTIEADDTAATNNDEKVEWE